MDMGTLDLTTIGEKQYYDGYNPYNMYLLTFINYYITYISVVFHLATMMMMSWWCDYSKIAMAYSAQVLALHAFSWAIPTEIYRDWTLKRQGWFFVLGGINLLIWLLMIIFGLFFYYLHTDGIMQFFGFALFITAIFSQTPMVYMIIASIITMARLDRHEAKWGHLKPSDEAITNSSH